MEILAATSSENCSGNFLTRRTSVTLAPKEREAIQQALANTIELLNGVVSALNTVMMRCPDLEGEPRDPFAAPRSEAGEWMTPRRSSALVDYLKDAQQLNFDVKQLTH